MATLAQTREGWNAERLAEFLLSRISFISRPTTVADDLGVDFFCTIAEPVAVGNARSLVPRGGFGIQIKSSKKDFSISDKARYLSRLELPYFVGVPDTRSACLNVYSGEYLPLLFSLIGVPSHLQLRLVDRPVHFDHFFEPYQYRGTRHRLLCPLLLKVSAFDSDRKVLDQSERLSEVCSRVLGNIMARNRNEHTYVVSSRGKRKMMAGIGSVKVFRANMCARLAETFANLEWLIVNQKGSYSVEEFQAYQELYRAMRRLGYPLPTKLREAYRRLLGKVPITGG